MRDVTIRTIKFLPCRRGLHSECYVTNNIQGIVVDPIPVGVGIMLCTCECHE